MGSQKIVFQICVVFQLCYLIYSLDNNTGSENIDNIKSITIYHQLCDTDYTYRGIVNLYNPVTFMNNVQQAIISVDDYNYLKTIGEKDDIYKLKYVVSFKSEKEDTFYSFIKGRKILKADLSDTIEVLVDSFGQPVSINHLVLPSLKKNMFAQQALSQEHQFKTTVKFNRIEKGPLPDVAGYLAKIQKEKDARLKGVGKDNRSFLTKYWIYIVPIMIFVLLSGPSVGNQEGAPAR